MSTTLDMNELRLPIEAVADGYSTPTPCESEPSPASSPIGASLLARKRARELKVESTARLPMQSMAESSPLGASLVARKRLWAFQAGSRWETPDSPPGTPVELQNSGRFDA
jgi:hypothetical protein